MSKFASAAVSVILSTVAVLVTGCNGREEPGPEVPPSFGILSDREISVSAGEVSVSVEYGLENPVEGGEVTGSSAAGWIGGYEDITDSSKIRFTVEANSDTVARRAEVVLSYLYGEGSISDTLVIMQSAKGSGDEPGPGPENSPVFELFSEEVSVSHEENAVQIEYGLANAVEGGRLEGKSTAAWIGEYAVWEDMWHVGFTVEANPYKVDRSAQVVFSYVYGDEKVSDTVIVNQAGKPDDEPEPDPNAPEIVFLTGLQYNVPDEESKLSVQYFVLDPVDGARMEASAEVDWIGSFEYFPENSTVDFIVSANTTVKERTADVLFTYYYEKEGNKYSVSRSVSVVQEMFSPAAVEFEATYFSGHYFGDIGYGGEGNYRVNLSDQPVYNGLLMPGGTYYTFDIFSTPPQNLDDELFVPVGTYVLGQPYQTELMTLSPQYTYWCRITPDGAGYEIPYTYYTSATLTITEEGGGYLYYAELVDYNGTVHKLTYRGDAVIDNTDRHSTLLEDKEVRCSGMTGLAVYYGDRYGASVSEWAVKLTVPGGGDALVLDLLVEGSNDFEDGLPTGTFTPSASSTDGNAGEFLIGDMGSTYQGSWFYTTDAFGNFNEPYAPFIDGKIVVAKDASGVYTITVDCTDDARYTNTITAEWSGEIELMNGVM